MRTERRIASPGSMATMSRRRNITLNGGLEWRVEETCLNAWPALREVLLDDWVLRFSAGLTRRANSANPLRPASHVDLQVCEPLYRRAGLPTIIRMLSLIDPEVDDRLAKAGYAGEGESCVLYAP